MHTIVARALRACRSGLILAIGVPVGAHAWPSPHSLPEFAYVSPAPGSSLHPSQTNIIVRPGGLVDPTSLDDGVVVEATGSASGPHAGRLKLSEDGRAILFLPDVTFSADEIVTCVIAPGIRTDTGGTLPGAQFTFRIAPGPTSVSLAPTAALLGEADESWSALLAAPGRSDPARDTRQPGATDSLPSDFPEIQASVHGAPADGAYFLCDISFSPAARSSYLMILREDGSPIWYRKIPDRGLDFKVQPNRWLTYYLASSFRYYALNANYALVDSFHCGNGYGTDGHELVILPNGHALLMAYDARTVDMTAYDPGGRPNATVFGLIIQELDREKDVVFQWRSWDHFRITDMTGFSLTAATIDYAHGNAIEMDSDGDLLISCRHMDEITKISRETGAMLWRLGGKNNEFTFLNDPEGFTRQHAIRRLPNGHISLFDNGNGHVPPHSRGVEYALDEETKTATLVWQYRNTPDTYGAAMGYVQRLPNGNSVIGWGSTNPSLTEVSPAGTKLVEITLPPAIYSYRAFKYEWPPVLGADVTLEPRTVNWSSAAPWVDATVESNEFPADSIDIGSVRLAGAPATEVLAGPADLDLDGRRELKLRFARRSLGAYAVPGNPPLELTGHLWSGEGILGSASIRAASPPAGRVRAVSPVGAVPFNLALGAPGLTDRIVTLSVYDSRGRLIDRLEGRSDAEGFLSWSGRGPHGERLPSGIYHLRAESGTEHVKGSVVLLR